MTLQRTPLNCFIFAVKKIKINNDNTRDQCECIWFAAAAAAKNGGEAVSVYNMATRTLSPAAPPPSYQPSKPNRGSVHVLRFTFVRPVAGQLGLKLLSSFPLCRPAPAVRSRVFLPPSSSGVGGGLGVRAAACFISNCHVETSKRKGSHHIWTGPYEVT